MVEKSQFLQEVQKIFKTAHLQYIIGYANDYCGFYAIPFFAKNEQEIKQLIFSPFCVNNLAVYLKHYEGSGKIGIVVKGCDSRSVIQLLTEKRIPRENLIIIGMSCDGVIDKKKLQKKFPSLVSSADVSIKDDCFIFRINGTKHKVPKKDMVLEKCLYCEYPTSLLFDVLLGEKKQAFGSENHSDVRHIDDKSLAEKWEFWEKHFNRCIRCYACRNICPVCYCKECTAEQLQPQWLRRSVTCSENTVWHLTRAMHVAGRCTGCGECERVCPMNIPLMLLNKKILKEVKNLFDFVPGIDAEAKPLLAAYKPDDPEECIC
jgi:formate dehydrogenase subunit beta